MSSKTRTILVCALLSAATLAVYWPVLHNGFVNYDDNCYIVQNREIQAGVTWQGLAWAFGRLHGDSTYWHPLTWVSHMVDCQLFGLKPAGHHLVSVLFHALNSVLVFLLFKRLTGAFWRSALLAAFFALHPLQVDSVAWVAERKNLLSAMFFLLTVWAYSRFAETRKPKTEGQGLKPEIREPKSEGNPKTEIRSQPHGSRITDHSSRFYLLALLFFACGLMCKPVLVTLPCVLLLLDYWPLRRSAESEGRGRKGEGGMGTGKDGALGERRPTWGGARGAAWGIHPISLLRLVVEKLPFVVLSAASCLITIASTRGLGVLIDPSAGFPFEMRLQNALFSYTKYLGKALWPTQLAVFYPYPAEFPVERAVVCGLLLLGISGLAILTVRTRPYLLVGWFWFLGVLVPFVGLLQAGEQAMADRFAYVPLIGLFVMMVWGLAEWAGRWPRGRKGSGFQEIAAAAADGGAYGSSRSGVRGAGDSAPRASEDVRNVRLGETPRPTFTPGSRGVSAKPEGLAPTDVGGYDCLDPHRRWGELVLIAVSVIALGACAVLTNRQTGYWQNSVTLFSHSLAVTGDNARAHSNLGLALAVEGKTEESIQHLQETLRLNPEHAIAHWAVGSGRSTQGRFEEAIQHYETAISLKPDFPEALNDLAWLRATHPDSNYRNGAAAVELAERSCQLTKQQEPMFIGTLAAAYAEAGRFEDAVKTAERAKALAGAMGQKELAEKNRELIELYRQGKPFHEAR